MAGSLQPRVKTWVSTENVVYSDLNAEFDNVLTAMQPLLIDDYSANATQMQVTADPGEVGTESLATTLAGELARLRFMIREITGKDKWYETAPSSIVGLANAIGSGLTNNRLVSGKLASTSDQPVFLNAHGAARTVTVKGSATNFIYYIAGTEYTISTDVTLTGLTAAPSTNNTALINDVLATDQVWTKHQGEDGTEIPVDNMGTEITALVGSFAAFKLAGVGTEYLIAYVKSATSLTKVKRGYFFDSTDAAIARTGYSDNDTLTLMKLTWIFAKTDGTLTATYNNPVWSDDEPSSPAIGDYWFDYSANIWKVYGVGSFSTANAILVGACIQDTTNAVAARSFEFFKNYDDLNTLEIFLHSNTQVKSRYPGSQLNVWGASIKNDHNLHTWDMTLDLDSGVTESASTHYYFYITEDGDKIISDVKPHDRREDLFGYYHPHKSWRCVGRAFNDASQNLSEVESYFRHHEEQVIRSVISTDIIMPQDRVIIFSGASFTEYLPASVLHRGRVYTFVHNGTSLSQVYTLDGFGSETIGGSTTYGMYTAGEVLRIMSDGSNWIILDHKTATNPVNYSPTSSGLGTLGSLDFKWNREANGKFMVIEGILNIGTVSAATARITIPTGATLDTTLTGAAQTRSFGSHWAASATGASIPNAANGPWALIYESGQTGSLSISTDVDSDVGFWVLENGNVSHPTGANISWMNVRIPISGWMP